jgi:hypothetical protein
MLYEFKFTHMYDTQTGTFSAKEIIEFILIFLGFAVVFGAIFYICLSLVLHKKRAKKIKIKRRSNNLSDARAGTILSIINSTSNGNWKECKSRITDYLEHEFSEPDLIKMEFVDRKDIKDIYITLPDLENYHFRLEGGNDMYTRK